MAKHNEKSYYDEKGNLIIKPYRLTDLAVIFDVNYRTFKRWIGNLGSEVGKPDGKFYSIKQVEYMIAQFGLPRRIDLTITSEELKAA